MKITHIHIERFRGFQNEDFEVGSLLTAIAGQNGTQKSTLLGNILNHLKNIHLNIL